MKKTTTREMTVCACLYYPGFEKCALSEDNARSFHGAFDGAQLLSGKVLTRD